MTASVSVPTKWALACAFTPQAVRGCVPWAGENSYRWLSVWLVRPGRWLDSANSGRSGSSTGSEDIPNGQQQTNNG